MTTIYTASATNAGFYITAAVAAATQVEAYDALVSFFAEDSEGGEYRMADDLMARIADEDGWYDNDGSDSMDLNTREWAVEQALAAPGVVVMLDSGGNG